MMVRIILKAKNDPLNNLVLKDVTKIEVNSVNNKDMYFFYSNTWIRCNVADVETLIIEE